MRTLTAVVASLLIALVAAGCGTGVGTVAPSLAPTGSLVPPLTGQTDMDWGRIWDDLPADFPIYPGATPSEEATSGPASATLVVGGADAKAIVTWMTEHLTLDAYTVEGGGPMEDGSFVIDAGRGADCAVHVDVAPLGTVTTITILYGASCPNT